MEKEVKKAILNERLRCLDILHEHFMGSKNPDILDAIEAMQHEILDSDFFPAHPNKRID